MNRAKYNPAGYLVADSVLREPCGIAAMLEWP